ncbi:DoxX family protein [Verrucomicrobium sp. BvORR106]|uniref:DoxX family protein n=1 Tax=Verrucomicrobium sp. BvORR106 TaxID=1403819 RepID=UPI00056E2F2C|nr:DoxX family protein [Verrucomicrobium sp. BvORR106]
MKIALWIVQILLALAFGASGFMKVFAFDQFVASAPDLANQQGLFAFIGIAELVGAVGLILPALTGVLPVLTTWAAVGLGTIMVLGTGLHIMKGEWSHVPVTVILLALNVFVVWGRGFGSQRKSTARV